MGLRCLACESYWLRDLFLLVARSGVVFKVQKMAQYASFCLIMGPFKGELPVFARLWPVWLSWTALRRHLTLTGPAICLQAQLVSTLQVHM